MLRVIDELCWTLRRSGFAIAPERAALAARAVALVGFDDKQAFTDALSTVLAASRDDATRLSAMVSRYFDADGAHRHDLAGRLAARGVDADVIATARAIAESLAEGGDTSALLLLSLLDSRALSHRLLSRDVSSALDQATNPSTSGYFVERVSEIVGVQQARGGLARLRAMLVAALGDERGGAVADLLAEELELSRGELRAHVLSRIARAERPRSPTLSGKPFALLDAAEQAEVRRAVATLAARLSGGARVRRRRRRRGRIDHRRTLRASFATGGAPMRLLYKDRTRDKPRLIVVSDVSASVRPAAVFLLELTRALHELFATTRSFVFVSDVVETTSLFAEAPDAAVAKILSGDVVPLGHDSSYGRALSAFERLAGASVDRGTTVVFVGDGRTNYGDPRVDVVARLKQRARHVLWLCTDPTTRWGTADSAMRRYAEVVHQVLPATCAEDLEAAARAMVRRR